MRMLPANASVRRLPTNASARRSFEQVVATGCGFAGRGTSGWGSATMEWRRRWRWNLGLVALVVRRKEMDKEGKEQSEEEGYMGKERSKNRIVKKKINKNFQPLI
ncbi:hypothetical protein E2542_SST23798 [Spatholobus suberectus]|nr:hypothetical protein E2542_SST23789 [Spatholobus suberectus]TKY52278.1 hypothetical protein E2542_SST23798 [Spatholobus suberectus]